MTVAIHNDAGEWRPDCGSKLSHAPLPEAGEQRATCCGDVFYQDL